MYSPFDSGRTLVGVALAQCQWQCIAIDIAIGIAIGIALVCFFCKPKFRMLFELFDPVLPASHQMRVKWDPVPRWFRRSVADQSSDRTAVIL